MIHQLNLHRLTSAKTQLYPKVLKAVGRVLLVTAVMRGNMNSSKSGFQLSVESNFTIALVLHCCGL